MANPQGSLNLSELDDRFVDTVRDSTIASATRYRYLQDAYSRVWYMHPWDFRKAVASFSVSAAVSEYVLDENCDLIVAAFNNTDSHKISTNKGFWNHWNSYTDLQSAGSPQDIIDFRSENGNNTVVLGQVPSTADGHGDQIDYYYFKHLVHNDSTGATATGTFSVSTDVPSFAPQFHAIIVKEALLDAIKDKRQFAELYQTLLMEKMELLKMMKKRYFTPARNNNQVRVIR